MFPLSVFSPMVLCVACYIYRKMSENREQGRAERVREYEEEQLRIWRAVPIVRATACCNLDGHDDRVPRGSSHEFKVAFMQAIESGAKLILHQFPSSEFKYVETSNMRMDAPNLKIVSPFMWRLAYYDEHHVDDKIIPCYVAPYRNPEGVIHIMGVPLEAQPKHPTIAVIEETFNRATWKWECTVCTTMLNRHMPSVSTRRVVDVFRRIVEWSREDFSSVELEVVPDFLLPLDIINGLPESEFAAYTRERPGYETRSGYLPFNKGRHQWGYLSKEHLSGEWDGRVRVWEPPPHVVEGGEQCPPRTEGQVDTAPLVYEWGRKREWDNVEIPETDGFLLIPEWQDGPEEVG